MSYLAQKDKTQGFAENYFDIDDILSTQQRVPSKFDQQVYNLGYLEAGSDNDHIMPGTKMELPFWMARALCNKRKTVSTELPKQYKSAYREILRADATVVDLHKLGPYYYTYGTLLLQFNNPDTQNIAKSLLQTFQGRFRKIMDSSQNAFSADRNKLTEKLDETERKIFYSGQHGLDDFLRWQKGETQKITISDMVVNHRKRKRIAMDS